MPSVRTWNGLFLYHIHSFIIVWICHICKPTFAHPCVIRVHVIHIGSNWFPESYSFSYLIL